MANNINKEEENISEENVKKNDDLRTIECLRGRLLAERHASRVANQDAELMSNKLAELENQLKEEIKLRRKAEKKLKLLKKKLESSKIFPTLDHRRESEQLSSASSDCYSTVHSFRSSNTSDSGRSKDTEEFVQSEPHIPSTPEKSQILNYGVRKDAATPDHTRESSSSSSSSSSASSDSGAERGIEDVKDPTVEKSGTASQDSDINDNSINIITRVKSSMEENEEDDYVDDLWALVPVTMPVKSHTTEVKIMSASVREVLDALKHAREKVTSSMDSRSHIVRVGPS